MADDALLGKLVRAQGLTVALAHAIPATTVPETRLAALFPHELRWARTVKSVAPVGFVLSARCNIPLFWATLMLVRRCGRRRRRGSAFADRLAGARRVGGAASTGCLQTARGCRCGVCRCVTCLSVVIMLASYRSNRVAWRGQEHRVTLVLRAPSCSPAGDRIAMMKTLFLQPPSFGGFDGGAGSRYQAKREISSFWYPTWLAQPAALVPGSKLIDAPPANIGMEPVLAGRQAARPGDHAHQHAVVRVRREGGRRR